jgi:hypothetical protein
MKVLKGFNIKMFVDDKFIGFIYWNLGKEKLIN